MICRNGSPEITFCRNVSSFTTCPVRDTQIFHLTLALFKTKDVLDPPLDKICSEVVSGKLKCVFCLRFAFSAEG